MKVRRARAVKSSRLGLRRILLLLAKVVGLIVLLSVMSVVALRWVRPVTSAVMVERRVGALVHARWSFQLRHQWVPWSRISPNAPLAMVAAEDQKFPDHHGFDVASIQKALDAHDHGQRLRGASTISQQVAKNLFLWSGRSFIRKGLEAYFTTLIEVLWPKRRILEVYLNIVELGEGVFGVEAASQRYFHKPAARLSTDEAALLAAVLPNPFRLRVDRPSAYVLERRGWIVEQMGQLGGTSFVKQLR